jgi:uncharacterized protein (DUF111 family)
MMRAELVGYGAGHLRLDFPNVLRVVIGEEEPASARTAQGAAGLEAEGVANVLISASVPEPGSREAAVLIQALFDAGADEAWLTPSLRAGREPRSIVTAQVPSARRDAVVGVLRGQDGIGPIRQAPVTLVPPG